MERCVLYLYPYIPDVLFKGLGHTQIDKLLAIRGNAEEVWQIINLRQILLLIHYGLIIYLNSMKQHHSKQKNFKVN